MAQDLKAPLLIELLQRGDIKNVLVFTRTKHRANRLAETLMKHRASPASASTATAPRRSARRRSPASRAGSYRVLVATDIAARGIDVEALSHVINFDVPNVPEDYIHRVGRTARAEMTGDAFTFVSPEEQTDLAAIERAIGQAAAADHRARTSTTPRRRPSASRCRSPSASPQIRARKAEERLRAKQKAERRASHESSSRGQGPRPSSPARPAQRPSGPAHRPAHGHRTSHGQPAQPSAGYGRRSR